MDRRSVNYISCFLSYNFVCVMAVYNFGFITCMNRSSGDATVGLVAEVTGLVGFTGARSGSEHETNETNVWSENINDIIRTS
jgi:hypothetical protein